MLRFNNKKIVSAQSNSFFSIEKNYKNLTIRLNSIKGGIVNDNPYKMTSSLLESIRRADLFKQ
jgi:hypothetical protein